MNKDDSLFVAIDWHQFEADLRKLLAEEISGWDENRLLNTSVDELCRNLVKKHRIDVPVLDRGNMVVSDLRKAPVDARHDRLGPIERDTTGTEIEITVPFTGQADVFKIKPQRNALNLNPARGNIKDRTVTFSISADLERDEVKRRIDQRVDRIDHCLTSIREDADILNSQLDLIARNRIEQCRENCLRVQKLVASLDIKCEFPKN